MMTQQIGKLKPNTDLNQQSTNIYNVTVLQRIDPFIEEILITIAQVTFYQFNLDLHQWNRKDVEGPLFVVKRNAQPRFQFIVMSRRNTDNLVEDLLGDFEYDVQAPYLLYRNAAQEVNGIWFYNELECEAVANLFSRILNAYSKVPPKLKVSSTKSVFEELEAVPTVAVIEGSVEPPTSSAATSPDDSFLNFFVSAAMIGGNTANTAIPEQPHHPPLPTQQPSLSLPAQPTPLMPVLNTIESSSRPASLVKPSLFASPPLSSAFMMAPITSSSSTPNAPPIHPPVTMQHGSPLLQPFPPPSPSPSLTPNNAPVITRDGVRDALLRLVQNNQFIDIVYREMLNAHNP